MRTYLAKSVDEGFHHDFDGRGRCFLGSDDYVVLKSRVHFVVPA